MDNPKAWLKKLLIRKFEEDQEEQYLKQIPFRETEEWTLKRLRERGYTGTPPDQKNRNFMIMELLAHIPEFKKDVVALRKKFEIKEYGFESEYEIEKWSHKNNFDDYQFPGGRSNPKNDFPSNVFERGIFDLGTKYHLPFNFYSIDNQGLYFFVLTGRIRPPKKNYDIDFRMDKKGKALLWSSLIIYASLSEKEAKEMAADIRGVQRSLLSQNLEGVDSFAKKQYRENIARDLLLIDEQIARSEKPKKIKKYIAKSYLDILSKSKMKSAPKEAKKLEHRHKKDIFVEYSNPTSKQIGKKQGVSGGVARQAKRRLNLLAKELFGYDLEP